MDSVLLLQADSKFMIKAGRDSVEREIEPIIPRIQEDDAIRTDFLQKFAEARMLSAC